MRRLFSAGTALALSACALGGDANVAMLLNYGHLRIEAADPGASYDYRLNFAEVRDFGWDLANREDRERLTAGALAENCASVTILDETRVVGGSFAGREAANWTVFAKCVENIAPSAMSLPNRERTSVAV